jgi:hypothetical protein
MPINFIVNDPAVQGAQPLPIQPSRNRTGAVVDFAIGNLPAEQTYAVGTNEFVTWQAREAALRTLNTFEAIAGRLTGWVGNASKKKLALIPNDGQDLNAYYNRASVSFFEFPLGQSTLFSGASTDVVAHEVGHAILDALRSDLWDSKMIEIPAFHEGFGDCMSIMTALSDRATRVAILQNDPTLNAANFVEAMAEELSSGISRAISPNHNAAQPRRALNTFQWALPQSLPEDGKPGVLINEIHSFGQLTSGCYYELIREIFLNIQGGEAGLWQACQTATKLLATAVTETPIRARFLLTVGQTMILVDRDQNNGANETFIRTAFQRHGIALSVTSFLARRAALDAPKVGTKRQTKVRKGKRPKNAAAMLTAPARRFLHSLLEVSPNAKLQTNYFAPTADTAQVVAYRSVDLTGLSERLADVKAYTPYSALVGTDGDGPAVLGAVDPGAIISSEVRNYVATLVHRGHIDFSNVAPATKAAAKTKERSAKTKKKAKAKKAKRGAGFFDTSKSRPTHVLKRVGNEVVIERVSFACGCAPARLRCVSA